MKLKVLSWNIWYDGDFEAIARFLADSEADIIGLQEVVPDDPNRDVIGYLAARGYDHVVAPVKKIKDGRTMSNAVFSKHRIVGSETYVLSEAESRNAVRADVSVAGELLHVFSTHLLHVHQKPSEIQELQAENLLKAVPPKQSMVMGDFNATPDSVAVRKILQGMDADIAPVSTVDASAFDCGVCNPAGTNAFRLDYIFTSKDLKAGEFQIHGSSGSDHLPLSLTVDI